MNVQRMRRYADRGRDVRETTEAEAEHADWLARMTPEHRAFHETGAFGRICPDCMRKAIEPLRRLNLWASENGEG